MAFHQQDFAARFHKMGDEAEKVCSLVYDGKVQDVGLRRPPFYMGDLTPEMKFAPDLICRSHYIECMGVGRDGTLKLKLDKLEAQMTWAKHIGPVTLFVWNSHTRHWYESPLSEWREACHAHAEQKAFENDGNEYWALKLHNFAGVAVPLRSDLEAVLQSGT